MPGGPFAFEGVEQIEDPGGVQLGSRAMSNFTIERTINARPDEVFTVLTNHRGYSDITPIRRAELEKEGSPVPNGVGAIRKLSLLGPPMREEVIEYEVGKRFAYTLISGLPVKDHVGTVTLTKNAGGGTDMVYEIETTPTAGPLGFAVVAGIKTGVKQLINGIAKKAEGDSVVAA
jgi:uncharacterized protein YndB with AHSA1/START domain